MELELVMHAVIIYSEQHQPGLLLLLRNGLKQIILMEELGFYGTPAEEGGSGKVYMVERII